ncbi:hypothetical protein [Halobacillus sp. A5]|uniref:hypothetical protein n=1 Tax=Halobacillus sp. A5 TaxID=2880263 RepID=UPI0020A6C47A|nr:hypothetical protein [Halobacillus sp. A5]MCP3027180.1 hypothetical protein [Halobacillus sp. A5]
MTLLTNKYFISASIVITALLLAGSFILLTNYYFNTKEINSFTSQCYDHGGQVLLEIHNNFTNDYSFECKR